MILVDSNIPMYLVGAEHPNKERATRLIDEVIDAGERLVTDAEVLQEILHRYVAIRRRDAIQQAFDAVLELVDDVLAIEHSDAEEARAIILEHRRCSARDAVHVAVMRRHQIKRILTFDRGFDRFAGIQRIT